MYDFDSIDLSIKDKYKLFVTKKRKKVPAEFLGNSLPYFIEIAFVCRNYSDKEGRYGESILDGTLSVTDTYHRYLIHQRKKVFFGILKAFITPIVVSIVTSILTVLILHKLGLG